MWLSAHKTVLLFLLLYDCCLPYAVGEWNIARVNGYFKSSLKGGSPIQWAILYPEDFRNLNGVKDAIKEVY